MNEVELIAACENVCRDFHWLGSFSDWGPTLLASVTALIIAFKAYPWQKSEDRKLQIELEQRRVYEELVAQFTEARLKFSDIKFDDFETLEDSLSKTFKVRRELIVKVKASTILMHSEIVPIAIECSKSTSDILRNLSSEIESILQVLGPSEEINKKELNDRCKPVLKNALREFDRAIDNLANEVRVRAYKLPPLDRI